MRRLPSFHFVGRHLVQGLWFPGEDLGAQRRVIAWWRRGSVVHRVHGGLWLRWPVPEPHRVEQLPGLPTLPIAGHWQTAPARTGTEVLPHPHLVLAWHGRVHAFRVDRLEVALLEALLPEPPPRVGSRGLGRPPGPVGKLETSGREGVREALGVGTPEPVSLQGGAASGAARGWATRLLAALRPPARLPGPGAASPSPTPAPTGSEALASPEAEPVPTPWWSSLLRRLGVLDWLIRRALASLSEELLELEDLLHDDLDTFLRRALPLGREGGSGGPPRPLHSLPDREVRFDRPRPAGGTHGALPAVTWDYLERLYQRALSQAERAGRHREAAYVLAELLDKPQQALAYLERHGLHGEAAELAKARQMAPAVVVRCLVQAGRLKEAARWARVHGALGEAVAVLEPIAPELARRLRVVWAVQLRAAGRLADAVSAVWSAPGGREQAVRWIDERRDQGLGLSPALLALRLAARPEEVEAVEPLLSELLTRPGPRGVDERATLVTALAERLGGERRGAQGNRAWIRRVVRASLPDPSVHHPHELALQKLAKADPLLAADLPAPPKKRLRRFAEAPVRREVVLDPDDVGSLPIHDAVPLPGACVLLALGEAGVELWSGPHRVRRWSVPTTRLVPSDAGHVAFAGVARGEVCAWVRLELGSGAVTPMGELPSGPVADSFDGVGWWVAEEDRLTLLDATADRWESLWSVPMIGVLAIAREGDRLGVIVGSPGPSYELFRYDKLTLRNRVEIPPGAPVVGVHPNRVLVIRDGALHAVPGPGRLAPWPPQAETVWVVRSERWCWWQDRVDGAHREQLMCGSHLVQVVRRGEGARARFHAGCLATFDPRGRVRVTELGRGEVLIDLRR